MKTIFTKEFREQLFEARKNQNRVADRQVIDLLVAEVLRLEDKVDEQNRRLVQYGWMVNPDTSGGAFRQDEIDRSRNGGW